MRFSHNRSRSGELIVHINGIIGPNPVATAVKEEVKCWLLLFWKKKDLSIILVHSLPDKGGMLFETYEICSWLALVSQSLH